MKPHNTKGIQRLLSACKWSWQGLRHASVNEVAFRQELMLSVVLIPLALWLGSTPVEKAMLVSSVLIVLIVELLNSGLEAVVDRIGPEEHPLSGRAKDMGSAAVFISLINAAAVWACILLK